MSPVLSVSNVTVKRAGANVLDGISFTVAPGERLAIAGGNGAGKTTLLRAIVGLEPLAAGRIEALGQPLASEKDFKAIRGRVGFLFQDPEDQLFCPTVIEDVMFGPLNLGLTRKAAIEKARDTLAMLKLDHLETRITHRLSGGEKRLVSLASVLAMSPEILLLDEPCNALDEGALEKLMDILGSLTAAMVIISHDWRALGHLAERALILSSGRLSQATIHRHPHIHDHVHIHAPGDEASEVSHSHEALAEVAE